MGKQSCKGLHNLNSLFFFISSPARCLHCLKPTRNHREGSVGLFSLYSTQAPRTQSSREKDGTYELTGPMENHQRRVLFFKDDEVISNSYSIKISGVDFCKLFINFGY